MMVQQANERGFGFCYSITLGNYLKQWVLGVCLLLLGMMVSEKGWGQLSLTNASPAKTIDFSTTINGVNNGAYAGSGFSSSPSTGQLNSNAWAATGWSDGSLVFGASNTTGDYSRGAVSTAQTTGGFYAFTGSPGSASNPSFMIQPGSGDFAPGTLTLRIINNGTSNITSFDISFKLFVRNDQGRSNSLNFLYSSDNITYTNVSSLDYTSATTADALGWLLVGSKTTSITGLNITPGSYYYFQWLSNDVGGSGSRDEFGLDDISVTATYIVPGTSTLSAGATAEPATISSLVNSLGASSVNFDFDYKDDGTTPGTDALATQISQIVIGQGAGNAVADWTQAIAGAELSDGSNTKTATVNATNLTFASLLNASGQIGYIADDATKTYSLKIWLKSSLTIDGNILEFNIQNSGITIASGSTLAAGQSVSSGNTKNVVTVVATALNYTTQPAPTTINSYTNFSTQAVVKAQDANGNTDLDFASAISAFSNTQGFTTTNNPSGSFLSGSFTFPANFQFTSGGVTPTNITFTAGGLSASSTAITVNPPAPEINVQQSSTNYLTGSTYSYNNQVVGTNTDIIFTIQNTGTAVLNITSIVVSGTSFSLQGVAPTTVTAGGTATFTVRFAPGGSSAYAGTVTISNNDADEGTYVVNLTGTGIGSSTSDVISAGNEYNSNIPYASYAGGSTIALTTDGFKVWSFTIRDGGSASDADNYATKVSAITITKGASNGVTSWANTIRSAAIFDGTTLVKAIANVSAESLVFNTFTDINVPDNGSKTIDLYITFETSSITDNQQFQFQILSSDLTVGSATSTFAAFTAPVSSVTGDLNRIEVTASKIAFVQQPTNVTTGSVFSPTVSVETVDNNNNRDYDYTTAVSLAITSTSVCNSLGGSSSVTPSNGLASFSTLKVNVPETGITLTASSGAFSTITSNSFNVTGGSATNVTLVGWNFADGNNLADVGITGNTSASISNNATGSTDFPQGQLASPDKCAINDGWTSGSGTKAWTTSAFSTSGYSSITFSSVHRGSGTGPRDFKVQYSINGGSIWADVPSATLTITAVETWDYSSPAFKFSNFALPSACDNQASVRLRWIMTSNSGITSALAAGGTNAIDEIYVYGNINTNAANLYYRSKQTGAFESACSWETSTDGVGSWIQAVSPPDFTSKTITIQSPHNVTINSSVWIDELVVDIGGTLTLSDVSLKFNNGTGTDMTINGTFIDNSTPSNNAVFNTGASWALGSSGTLIKTRNSSSSVYRDNYNAGMSSIPATANWIIRYTGAGDVSFTTTGGTYYPNLTFENSSASPYSFLTKFTGSSAFATIKGDLDVGGNTYTLGVTVTNENTNTSPLSVMGKLTVRSGSMLTNVGATMGTGFEVQGDVDIIGTLTADGSGTSGVLKLSGSSPQKVSGNGTANIYDLTIANTTPGSVLLTKDINVQHLLTLTNGIVTTSASPNGLLSITAGNSSSLSGGSSSSYINGPLKRAMSTADASTTIYNSNAEYIFPVGKSAASSPYRPCSVYPTLLPGAVTESFQAEYNPGTYSHSYLGNLGGIRDDEYWQIDKKTNASASTAARIKLNYVTSNNTVDWYPTNLPCSNCNVVVSHAQNNGSIWYDAGYSRPVLTYSTQPPFIEARGWKDATGVLWTIPLTSFSPFGFGYNINQILPLPVKLLSFTGRLQHADGKLEWKIADARDLDGFELEYSRDGRVFQPLSSIPSNGSLSYGFLHKDLPAGANYYRLLVKEKTGNTFYSQVVILNPGKLVTYVIGISPANNGGQLNAVVYSASNQKLQASITDVLGRQIINATKPLTQGTNQWNMQTNSLPKGLYFLILRTDDGLVQTTRFMKG